MSRSRATPQALLARLPLLAELDAGTLARLAAGTERRALERGDAVLRVGEPVTAIHVVVYGEVRLSAPLPGGGARLTGVARPGSSFGEAVMFLERPAVVDAVAACDTLLLQLPKGVVFDELEHSPAFARRLLAGLSQRVHALVGELDLQASGGGAARLAAYLLREAPASSGPFTVTLPATKAAIASQLNLTAEHFSRLLHGLAARGLLRVDGRRIAVADAARLAELVQR